MSDVEFGDSVPLLRQQKESREFDEWFDKEFEKDRPMYAPSPEGGIYRLSPGELDAINKNTEKLVEVHKGIKNNSRLFLCLIILLSLGAVLLGMIYFNTGIIGRALANGLGCQL